MRLLTFIFLAVPLFAELPKRAPELESLVDRARSLPAEFAAEGLLRLSAAVADPKWKQELLEDAFQRASGAQWPVKRRVFDSPPLDRAYAQGLDRLSLQTRALEALLPFDPRRAQELFLQMPSLELKLLTCDDHFTYDVDAYYRLLAAILQGTFTAAELREERHLALAVARLAAIESPVQLGPAARMIQSLGIADVQRAALESALKSASDRLPAEARRPACPDDAQAKPKPCATAGCVDLAARYRALVFGADGLPVSAGERAKTEWRSALDDYLAALRDVSDVPFADVCKLYSDVSNLAPDAASRERILRSLLDFLRAPSTRPEGRPAWFLPVNSLLARTFTDRTSLAPIATALRASDDPVIAFFAELEARYPRPLGAAALLF